MKAKIVSIRQIFNEDGTHNCYEIIIDFDSENPLKLILGEVELKQ